MGSQLNGLNDFAREWVADLRAHPEVQGHGLLHSLEGKFCCLGRAAMLWCTKEGVAGEEAMTPLSKVPCWSYLGEKLVLPDRVRKALGLRTVNGEFFGLAGEPESLSYMNDHNCTFADIADTIESEPPGLFTSEG